MGEFKEYTWLTSYLKHKADLMDAVNSGTPEMKKEENFGIVIPFEMVLKVDKLNVKPTTVEKMNNEGEEEDGRLTITIPEICNKCYHLDETNKVCKANMDFKMTEETGDCQLFYDKEKLGGFSLGADKKDDKKIKKQLEQVNKSDVIKTVSDVMEEVQRINRMEKEGSLIVKKSNAFDEINEEDAVDLFLIATYKGNASPDEDNWEKWTSLHKISKKVKDKGEKELEKRLDKKKKKEDKKDKKPIQNKKLDEKENGRRNKEIEKFEKVIKRSTSDKEANRLFKRLCSNKGWGDVIEVPAFMVGE